MVGVIFVRVQATDKVLPTILQHTLRYLHVLDAIPGSTSDFDQRGFLRSVFVEHRLELFLDFRIRKRGALFPVAKWYDDWRNASFTL